MSTEYRETPAEAALLHFAAEAHRRKWSFTESSPEAFDALDRIGLEMRAAVDEVRKAPAPLGTIGQNTISRAELGAYYRRQGVDQAGDWAARVFHDIAAHRGPTIDAAVSGSDDTSRVPASALVSARERPGGVPALPVGAELDREAAAAERVRSLAQSWASLPAQDDDRREHQAEVDRHAGAVILAMLDSGTAAGTGLSRAAAVAEQWMAPGGPGLFYPAAGQAVLDAISGASTPETAGWRERAEAAEARLAELENAITWNTSCLSCASRLDFSYAETARREQAESRIADLENTIGQGIREAESMLRAMTEGREAGPEWVRRILSALGAQDQDRGEEKGPGDG